MIITCLNVLRPTSRSSYGAASLDSTINLTSRDQGASSSVAQGAASTRPSSARNPIVTADARNPIITADSIINTLQMEMATVGLTAAAISAASRYLDTTSEVGGRTAAERPTTTTIAPRPSLGRVDPVSSLPDNLASLLVSDQTSSAQFSSLLATPEVSTSRQSRLASMFTSEAINLSGGQEPASLTLHQSSNGGRLASLLSSDGNQLHLNNLLGTDITGELSGSHSNG